MPPSELQALRVLVTRPVHQAGPLCELIEQAGGQAVRFPVLAVEPLPESAPLAAILAQLDRYDLAIFISHNAVRFGIAAAARHGGIPATLRLAAVGEGSRRELERQLGRAVDLAPQGRFDSEALLALPPLQQVAGQAILIVRGAGGRELLAATLRQRGARVDYAEVYRRLRPRRPEPQTLAAWRAGGVNIITVTSNEGLQNLYEMVGVAARDWLLDMPLLVVSERSAALARELGFRQPPLVAASASEPSIVETLARWAGSHVGSPFPKSGES